MNDVWWVYQSEHGDEVTCLDWDLGQTRLYSGSKDKHVMAWNVGTGECIRLVQPKKGLVCHSKVCFIDQCVYFFFPRKWKVDKGSVQCICCYGNGSFLLTAGHVIKLWSLEDYTLVKVSRRIPEVV